MKFDKYSEMSYAFAEAFEKACVAFCDFFKFVVEAVSQSVELSEFVKECEKVEERK